MRRIGTKTSLLENVDFDNFGGLTFVLKFHTFFIFNCEELVHARTRDVFYVRRKVDVIKTGK